MGDGIALASGASLFAAHPWEVMTVSHHDFVALCLTVSTSGIPCKAPFLAALVADFVFLAFHKHS